MIFQVFDRNVLQARNPRKPAACLLILWVGSGDGAVTEEELEIGCRTAGSDLRDLHHEFGDGPDRRCLQLACEIMRDAPPWAQLAVLITAIRMAIADGELAIEENLILRFLCDAFDYRHDLDELHELQTGEPAPELPAENKWWAGPGVNAKRVHRLLTLIGQLRADLAIPDSDWWEPLQGEFTAAQHHNLEFPRLEKRRDFRWWRRKLIPAAAVAGCLLVLTWIFITRSPAMQYRAVWKEDTIEAYQKFLDDFPDSKSSADARIRLDYLFDLETWAKTKAEDSLPAYRTYLRKHPDGQFRKPAEEAVMSSLKRRIELAFNQWNVAALKQIENENSGLAVVEQSVAEALDNLRNDPDWLRLAGSLEECRAYLERNPDTPERDALEKRVLQLESVQPPL